MSPDPTLQPLPPVAALDPTEREIDWRQYSLHYDLYKFHLEATAKFLALMFAITGTTMGYYLKELAGRPDGRWVLIPAIVLNLFSAVGFAAAARQVSFRKRAVAELAVSLNIPRPPNLTLLHVVVILAGASHIVCALGLGVLFARGGG